MTSKQLFADLLYDKMKRDDRVVFITADLGFNLWNKIQTDFPTRYFNCGASEQLMMGLGIGLALSGKIPVVYSITPFLLYRPFEWIRNYIDFENIPVKMIGSGRNKDYSHDGISHWAEDDAHIMSVFKNIISFYPSTHESLQREFNELIDSNSPVYLNLSTRL